MTQHPIAPPPDKIHNWLQLQKIGWSIEQIITLAAQWGADTELEACSEWLDKIAYRQSLHIRGSHLYTARRPKPASLKEQALDALFRLAGCSNTFASEDTADAVIIRRALEQLPDPS